jgi:hypothetical protein
VLVITWLVGMQETRLLTWCWWSLLQIKYSFIFKGIYFFFLMNSIRHKIIFFKALSNFNFERLWALKVVIERIFTEVIPNHLAIKRCKRSSVRRLKTLIEFTWTDSFFLSDFAKNEFLDWHDHLVFAILYIINLFLIEPLKQFLVNIV